METSEDRRKKILGPVSRALQQGAERAGFTMGGDLEGVLRRLQDGDVAALTIFPKELRAAVGQEIALEIEARYAPSTDLGVAVTAFKSGKFEDAIRLLGEGLRAGYVEASTVSPSGALYGQAFFARPRGEVSQHLCGSVLAYAPTVIEAMAGLVTHTAAYKASEKDRAIASAEPGTVGVWTAQGNAILIISAHEPGKEGTVAVWGMRSSAGQLGMGAVGQELDIRSYEGMVIGRDAPLQVMPRNLSVDTVGALTVGKEANAKGATDVYRLSR
ncbi:MAG TPA: hypothetical protein VJI15_05935 [Candidatus Nanoarchaeia archaeon]|nr:hypothetical protein [Candidatus Nanoarchaeia archaeon]